MFRRLHQKKEKKKDEDYKRSAINRKQGRGKKAPLRNLKKKKISFSFVV